MAFSLFHNLFAEHGRSRSVQNPVDRGLEVMDSSMESGESREVSMDEMDGLVA